MPRSLRRALQRDAVTALLAADAAAAAVSPGLAGPAGLTSSELRVVRVVAAGATNRAAAEQLHLSPHTVSSHLRSAYAKLGVHSRTQLAHVLREAGD
jgi:DNA-binding NarL/FixJ family response regulator